MTGAFLVRRTDECYCEYAAAGAESDKASNANVGRSKTAQVIGDMIRRRGIATVPLFIRA